jgi:hypothetical protein
MKQLFLCFVLLFASSVFAGEDCYQVSSRENSWSRTPEVLCLSLNGSPDQYLITLKTGLPMNEEVFAAFQMSLLKRLRCMNCNRDVFGIANTPNSSFSDLTIEFDGTRDLVTMKEEGRVSIGAVKLYYRSMK